MVVYDYNYDVLCSVHAYPKINGVVMHLAGTAEMKYLLHASVTTLRHSRST